MILKAPELRLFALFSNHAVKHIGPLVDVEKE
jgi:hypothetical protein